MIEFSREALRMLAGFLNAEPIIYLFGVIVSLFVVKGVIMLMRAK